MMNLQTVLDIESTTESSEDIQKKLQNDAKKKVISNDLSKEQIKTPSKHALKHHLEISPKKELHAQNIQENVMEDNSNKLNSLEHNLHSESLHLDDASFQGNISSSFSINTKVTNEDKRNEDDKRDTERNNVEAEDVDLIQEMLPDLYYHAQRVIQFLIPTSSFIAHVKKIITPDTKNCKKLAFLLRALKFTISTYTKTRYINTLCFSNYFSDVQMYTLFLANAALFLSELYSPFPMPPKYENLKQRYDSLYEAEQLFPSLFNTTFWHIYIQMIELRTQLFIHALWLNQISDQKVNSQFEDNEIKKYFMDETFQFKNWETGGEAYINACTQRIEKIKHIKESNSGLDGLIRAFPWHYFIKLMIKFIENNIIDDSRENIPFVRIRQDEETKNITFYNSHFSEGHEDDDKNSILLSKENDEQVFNSENEGEIPASDIKHLSQIVLGIENDDNEEYFKINNVDPRYKKSFFDKQQDYQKIAWESQNEGSELFENNMIQNVFNESITPIKKEYNYNKKRKRSKKQNQSYDIIQKVPNIRNITNHRDKLRTDAIFSCKSPDTSSNLETSSLSPNSPSTIPPTSSQTPSTFCKKSSSIQPLNSQLTMNNNTLESTNEIKKVENELNTNPYQDYSVIKKYLRANKIRERKYKPQHRVPWSETEVNCLMKAIQQYGSQWSFILSLYGPNGTLGNDLARRGQVQLKDKARNIKEEYIRARWKLPPGFESITCKYDSY